MTTSRREYRQLSWNADLETATRELMLVAQAEDLSDLGDLTSLATIPEELQGTVEYRARQPGIIAGVSTLAIAASVYDPQLNITTFVTDGSAIEKGTLIARLRGRVSSILAVERPSLNLLSRLSGIATMTRQRVDRIAHTQCRLYDTRKTTPGLRLLEKYAVRCGGGLNHRTGLFDGVLIKDNHLALAGDGSEPLSPSEAIRRARRYLERHQHHWKELPLIEVEVDSIEQLIDALGEKPDIVLLDNFNASQLREAVQLRNKEAPMVELEASGGINDQTLVPFAETGVDRLSMGALTHSAVQLDIGLDWIG